MRILFYSQFRNYEILQDSQTVHHLIIVGGKNRHRSNYYKLMYYRILGFYKWKSGKILVSTG
jgi:hypothetical protein